MLLRLAYLGVTNAPALVRALPGSDRDKDAEILALRHQLGATGRQPRLSAIRHWANRGIGRGVHPRPHFGSEGYQR